MQRAYRARLAGKGKLVRVVDAATFTVMQERLAVPPVAGFDPATQFVYDRAYVLRDNLRNALSKLVLRKEETERLRVRNAQLEADLKLEEQSHTVALKENISLKQKLERTAPKRR